MRPVKITANQSTKLDRSIIDTAKRVLKIESESIKSLIDRVDRTFVKVIDLIANCNGHVIITGIGKSGLIGSKIAATFSSIGVPSVFLHAAEGSHGDLGIISRGDVIIALSNSGETGEILKLLPAINRLKCTLVTMTGKPGSTLAKRSKLVLNVGVKEEACPNNIIPTASTTATLAMGDALAVALLEKKGFQPQDFAELHPGGILGKSLLTTVADLMHTGKEIPKVLENSKIKDVIKEISDKKFGTAIVANKKNQIKGVITDGDLRRLIEKNIDISKTLAKDVMGKKPKTIRQNNMAAKAIQMMEEHSITCLVVSDDKKTIDGIIHLHDLLKAGIV